MLDVQTAFLIDDADGANAPPSAGARARLAELEGRWTGRASQLDAMRGAVRALNDRLSAIGVPVVYVAPKGGKRNPP